MELNIGVLVTLSQDGQPVMRLQNYRVSDSVNFNGETFTFAPFSFSGAVTSLQGDNVEAGLVFPSNIVTRSWAQDAILLRWTARANIVLLNDDFTIKSQLYSYAGQVGNGGWNETTLELQLNSVLNAVNGNIPGRVLNRQLVGKIPITSSINV